MRTLTEAFAPGAPSLPEGLRTLAVSPDRTVEPGTTVRAAFAFYNFGGAAATGLRVRFTLPEGLRYVPGSSRVDDRALEDGARDETPLLASNGADVGEVPPGVERRIALAFTVASTIENGAEIVLQAALVANETDVIGSNVVRLTAVSSPRLENTETVIAIEAVRVAEPGEDVRVSARVQNSGHATAHDVVVVLPLPDRTTYVEGSALIDGREAVIDERGGDPFGFGNATIAATSLAAGAGVTVEYRARIDSPLDDNTRLIATGAVASAETAEFELGRAELTVRSAAKFDDEATRLMVDAPAEVEPGRRIRIALIAENTGTCSADEVRVRLTLPDGLRYAPGSRALDGRSASESEDPGAFTFARVDAGRRVEAAVDAYVVSPAVDATPLPIAATLQWSTGSRVFERQLTVRSSPRFLDTRNVLTLDGPQQVSPGADVRATIRVANDGTAQATGVRVVVDSDSSLKSLRYVDADGGTEARVQSGGIEIGTLAPGAARTLTLTGTVASPIADRTGIRIRARVENEQTPALSLGSLDIVVRSRPRFVPTTSTLNYAAGEALRPGAVAEIFVVLVNEGTDAARDVRLQLDVTDAARVEAVDGATRVGNTLLFGDVAPGARAAAHVRLRLARLVARGTTINVAGRLEAVGLLPFALAPVTIPTIAEPRFDDGATLRTQPSESVDAGEPLYVRLAVRNSGDGGANRLVVRMATPAQTAYLPGSTSINDVPLLDVDGGSVLWSHTGLVLEDVDPGVEVVVRYCAIVNTPLPAGTLVDAHADLTWDGGGTLALSAPAVRVRSIPAFAVRASGLPFSVSGIATRTSDVLREVADRHRAQVALPPAAPAPAAEAPPDRAAYKVDDETIDARFRPAPPAEPGEAKPEPTFIFEPPTASGHPAAPSHPEPAPGHAEPVEAPSIADALAALSNAAPVVAPEPKPEPETAEPVAPSHAEPVDPSHAELVEAPPPPVVEPEPDVAPAPVAVEPEPEPEPAPPAEPERPKNTRQLRYAVTREALERAVAFLEQSDYGGLVTHLFAIRTLLPNAFIDTNGNVAAALAAERESLRGVVDRLFIKMRMPRYALTGKDLEDRASRQALIELVEALRDAEPVDAAGPGDAAIVLEGELDTERLTRNLAALDADPLGSARPWVVLAEMLPSRFVRPPGGDALETYRTLLIATFNNVAALPSEEFHRVLGGTQNAALDAALGAVRTSLRAALEASVARS